MHVSFCAVLFNETQDLHFPKDSVKIVITAPPNMLRFQKLHHCHIFKVSILQKFVRFHAIESEIERS